MIDASYNNQSHKKGHLILACIFLSSTKLMKIVATSGVHQGCFTHETKGL